MSMSSKLRNGRVHLAWLLALCLACSAAEAAVTVLGVQYQPDQAFPAYDCLWRESQYPGPCSPSLLGANVHVYVRNDGASSVTIQDVLFAGFSLKDILSLHYQVVKRQPASIWLENLTSAQLQTLLNAGEPVWYKIDPAVIPAGGVAHVAVRLRSVPVTQPVNISVVTSVGNVPAPIPVAGDAPQVAGVGFSPDRTKVHIYWRRTGSPAPTTIRMDGNDVTANTTTVNDPAVGLVSSVVQLAQPLAPMSYHVFQGVYTDGKTATTGLRTWVNKFIYGSWGGTAVPDGDAAAAREALIDFTNHGMNGLVQNGSSTTAVLMKSNSGKQFVAEQDYGFVIDEVGKWDVSNPLMWFIRDEPDAADSRLDTIPSDKKVGSLAQMALQRGEELRSADPLAPTTVNIDGTYKPYNYYNYAQVPDVFMTDPYYQVRMREAYWYYPQRIPLYQKATYIYAVTQVANASCEPNPLHVILYSCEWRDSSGAVFAFPTPESKRIEVYYALAGGAKGLAYWWWPAGQPSNGLGDGGPEALALWKEIGLLGNEIKTAAPLLVTSCPVTMPIQASPGVWVRALAVGTDTLVLLAVNDQYINDEAGCHYTPVANATVTPTLPSWMQASPTAFEISAGGTSNVSTQLNGTQLHVNLGTLDLTRMIVITTNPQLRSAIQQRYNEEVQAAVCAFAQDVCTQSIPPTVTQQPQANTVCVGTTGTFGVTASGPGTLSYQWQKNQANLADGGRYAGVNSPTLAISGTVTGDAANYRCLVSNAHGTAVSDEAALTVITCSPGCLQNLSFEGGFTNGVGNGWTKFIRSGSVTCAAETTEVHGGSYAQEVYSPNKNNDGGVFQQFAATPGQPYTVKAWIKVYSPEGSGTAEGFFGIDPTGGTDPNSPNILWASKPWEYWSQDTWTVTAQNNVITVYLRGRSTRTGRTAYIWHDDVEIAPGSPTDLPPQVLGPTTIRWRWNDLAIETGYRVRDQNDQDKAGLLAANTTQWTETTGIIPNTQYTRRIHAVNDCGTSEPSSGRTVYSLIEAPADVPVGQTTATTISVSAAGTFSNLAAGSSGIRLLNTTAGTDSGWQKTLAPWTSAGLAPNTPYDFVAVARNGDGVETTQTEPVTAWTLSAPPEAASVTPSPACGSPGQTIEWTNAVGFGAGGVHHYLYAWQQSPTYEWTGGEPMWSSGTLVTTFTAPGTWYLHLQGYNGADVANGTYAREIAAGDPVAPDLDHDCDVDTADFTLFEACVSGPAVPRLTGCADRDFDGDGDVDLSDFGILQRCFRGQDQPPIPGCAD